MVKIPAKHAGIFIMVTRFTLTKEVFQALLIFGKIRVPLLFLKSRGGFYTKKSGFVRSFLSRSRDMRGG